MLKPSKDFFTAEEKDTIKQAIMNAELDTSGEIRVHIENQCSGDVMDRAAFIFDRLKINKTEKRNGILFYLAKQNRKFAILGDKGINAAAPEELWDELKNDLINAFAEGNFCNGLVDAIEKTGKQLKKHFPYQSDDVNELSDEISFGDE